MKLFARYDLPLPDRDVATVRDTIHSQYAKIIAKSAFGVSGSRKAKGRHYGFVKQTFRGLRKGVKSRGGIGGGAKVT